MPKSRDLSLSPSEKDSKTLISQDDSLRETSLNRRKKILSYKNNSKKKFILFHESPQILRPNRQMYTIKAGRTRMIRNISETDKVKLVCSPIPGLIRLRVDSKGFLLLTWENRITRKREFEFRPIPSTCCFKKIKECNDGCVVIFKDKMKKNMEFFWIQEKDPEIIENFLPKVNQILQMDR
uniref:Pru domain-containing protein n=1 Tax=Strongyloides venezuelensis TaxID=75913 RepID=A0A0K0FLL2_STRVS